MDDWYVNPSARSWRMPGAASSPRPLHDTIPEHEATPLVELPTLAAGLGVGRVLVKDESKRSDTASFKILGASWAATQVLARHPGVQVVTATEGNHGRALARAARELHTTCVVFVPISTLAATVDLITGEGAEVVRVAGTYDDAVAAAARYAAESDERELVQDTAWPGYEQVPQWIVDGYSTLLTEVDQQLGRAPDAVVVPVGVGSLAQSVVTHYRRPGPSHPAVLAVEPESAAALLASLLAGQPVSVTTGSTVMAGLNCGTLSSMAWPILQSGCDAAVSVSDDDAVRAVTDLGRLGISAGPSGAASLAGARAALGVTERREALALPDDPIVVLLNTEGGTA